MEFLSDDFKLESEEIKELIEELREIAEGFGIAQKTKDKAERLACEFAEKEKSDVMAYHEACFSFLGGFWEGVFGAKFEIALKMIAAGIDESLVSDYTGLNKPVLDYLRKKYFESKG